MIWRDYLEEGEQKGGTKKNNTAEYPALSLHSDVLEDLEKLPVTFAKRNALKK